MEYAIIIFCIGLVSYVCGMVAAGIITRNPGVRKVHSKIMGPVWNANIWFDQLSGGTRFLVFLCGIVVPMVGTSMIALKGNTVWGMLWLTVTFLLIVMRISHLRRYHERNPDTDR